MMLPGRQRSPTLRKGGEAAVLIDVPDDRDFQIDSSKRRRSRTVVGRCLRWTQRRTRSRNASFGLRVLGFFVASLLVLLVVVTRLSLYNARLEPFRDSVSPGLNNEDSYSIVIDAGSSGSRVMLYTWSKTRAGLPLIQKAGESDHDWQLKKEPGLSSFSGTLSGIAPYLKTLLDFAMERIPQRQHSRASLHLFATAGLRLLPLESQTKLLQEACSFAKQNYPFKIAACSEHFQVITGEWEGIYGWLTVNYLKNGLGSTAKGAPRASLNHFNSFGFLDMGGASAQIAFEPSPLMAKQHFNDLTQVKLWKSDGSPLSFNIFVTTFLEFGANEARRRYLQRLTKANEKTKNGASDRTKEILDHCLPQGLSTLEHGVTLKGTGKFDVCVQDVSPLLNKELPCPDKPCFFNGVHIPLKDFRFHRFIGVSEFWYSVYDVFGLGGSYNASTLMAASSKYCSSDWKDIEDGHTKGQFPHVQDMSRLKSQCFKSGWLLNILYEGFGFPRESLPPPDSRPDRQHDLPVYFESVNEINNFTVSWTLGAVLHQVATSIFMDD